MSVALGDFPTIALVGRPASPGIAEPLGRLARFLAARGHRVILDAATARDTPLQGFPTAPTGELGSMSDGERHLRVLLKQTERTPKLLQLLKSASPEGQLYALAGLRISDRFSFDRIIPSFLTRDERVTTYVGCIGSHEPMHVVAQRIADGKYDRDLQRPPW